MRRPIKINRPIRRKLPPAGDYARRDEDRQKRLRIITDPERKIEIIGNRRFVGPSLIEVLLARLDAAIATGLVSGMTARRPSMLAVNRAIIAAAQWEQPLQLGPAGNLTRDDANPLEVVLLRPITMTGHLGQIEMAFPGSRHAVVARASPRRDELWVGVKVTPREEPYAEMLLDAEIARLRHGVAEQQALIDLYHAEMPKAVKELVGQHYGSLMLKRYEKAALGEMANGLARKHAVATMKDMLSIVPKQRPKRVPSVATPQAARSNRPPRKLYIEAFPFIDADRTEAQWNRGARICSWVDEVFRPIGHVETIDWKTDGGSLSWIFHGTPNVQKKKGTLHVEVVRQGKPGRVTSPRIVCPRCREPCRKLVYVWGNWRCRHCHDLVNVGPRLGPASSFGLARERAVAKYADTFGSRPRGAAADRLLDELLGTMRNDPLRRQGALPEQLKYRSWPIWLGPHHHLPTIDKTQAPYGWTPQSDEGLALIAAVGRGLIEKPQSTRRKIPRMILPFVDS